MAAEQSKEMENEPAITTDSATDRSSRLREELGGGMREGGSEGGGHVRRR